MLEEFLAMSPVWQVVIIFLGEYMLMTVPFSLFLLFQRRKKGES